jgi:hypothetical protein
VVEQREETEEGGWCCWWWWFQCARLACLLGRCLQLARAEAGLHPSALGCEERRPDHLSWQADADVDSAWMGNDYHNTEQQYPFRLLYSHVYIAACYYLQHNIAMLTSSLLMQEMFSHKEDHMQT